jgi:hypothetical protein
MITKLKHKKVHFKSNPENWNKENSGRKRNTVRKRNPNEPNDERFDILDDWIAGKEELLRVEIENTKTGECFTQLASDVTKWEGIYIISW